MKREFDRDFLVELCNMIDPADFLDFAKVQSHYSTFVCPRCGSGSHGKGTGLSLFPYSDDGVKRWKCFNCGLFFNVIKLYEVYAGVSFVEAVRILASWAKLDVRYVGGSSGRFVSGSLGIFGNVVRRSLNQRFRQGSDRFLGDEERLRQARLEVIKRGRENLSNPEINAPVLAYLRSRGLSFEMAKRWWLGFIPEWRLRESSRFCSPRLIIPTSRAIGIPPEDYLARDIRSLDSIPVRYREKARNYAKLRGLGSHVNLYNLKGLMDLTCIPVVVEGELDALSVEQEGKSFGVRGVGLGTTAKAEEFLTVLGSLSVSVRPRVLILALDNDEPGREASNKMIQGLRGLGISFVLMRYVGKDPNAALAESREVFRSVIVMAAEEARIKLK